MKFTHVYYCTARHCPLRKKTVMSWLTAAELINALGGPLRCERCGSPMKWIRTVKS